VETHGAKSAILKELSLYSRSQGFVSEYEEGISQKQLKQIDPFLD